MTLVALFFATFLTHFTASAQSITCSIALAREEASDNKITETEATEAQVYDLNTQTNPPKDALYFIAKVEEANARVDRLPKFLDPVRARQLQELWKGTKEAPQAVIQTLPIPLP